MKILFMDLENLARPENLFHPGKKSRFGDRQAGFCADLSYILVFGYKWLGTEAQAIHLTEEEFAKDPYTDRPILEKALEVMDKADLVVTWYGKGHDFPYLASRLAQAGLYLDPSTKHLDLMDVAKKRLRLSSNSMNAAAAFFGLPKKLYVSPKLWVDCWAGKYQALEDMATYCKQDCDVLENLYQQMLGLGVSIPDVAKLSSIKDGCPSCGSTKLTGKGYRVTKLKRYQRLQCLDCGSSHKGKEV